MSHVTADRMNHTTQAQSRYRTIWRWHFYAGLFCIPLVLWLSCTGAIYLFKPQIERWLDRPYDHLRLEAKHATPEQIAMAATMAVPHASLHYYELPLSNDSAVRVVVGVGKQEYRVYVHPVTCRILNIVKEDKRPMRVLFYLHGELLAGDVGSYLVELAASWAVVLLLSGLYLWWPRQTEKLAGVLWIRMKKGRRIFWRDLHAVTGVWISAFALFLILTGLPWARGWGGYFRKVRQLTGTPVAHQEWSTSRASDLAEHALMNHNSLGSMEEMPGMNHAGQEMRAMQYAAEYKAFNRLVPVAASLNLAYPVEILPSMRAAEAWTIRSDAQNRTLRDVIQVDPKSGVIVGRRNFNQGLLLDRIVGTGVAAHEGQLFGTANQILGLMTAMGLVLLCVSAVVMWWRRRHTGVLGAPVPVGQPRWSVSLVLMVVALGVYLPEMTVSLFCAVLCEKLLLSRIPRVNHWLGLRSIQ